MKEFLLKYLEPMGIILIGVSSVSYGVSDFVPMTKALSLLLPSAVIGYYFLSKDKHKSTKQTEAIQLAEEIMKEQGDVIEEQGDVIKEYEAIFDSQLVELPCVCGGNTFQGMFSPKTENIVECEKCKNQYKVEISYNSVLISSPMDLTKSFEQLVGDLDN